MKSALYIIVSVSFFYLFLFMHNTIQTDFSFIKHAISLKIFTLTHLTKTHTERTTEVVSIDCITTLLCIILVMSVKTQSWQIIRTLEKTKKVNFIIFLRSFHPTDEIWLQPLWQTFLQEIVEACRDIEALAWQVSIRWGKPPAGLTGA